MTEAFQRIAAIVRADFIIRFRRLSTLVIFLLLSFFAYVWIPDPATGKTLMQIGKGRVLYNSAAIGMGPLSSPRSSSAWSASMSPPTPCSATSTRAAASSSRRPP